LETLSSKDLLYKILEFQTHWVGYSDIKPVTARLAQLDSLIEAFQLSKKYVNPLVKIFYSFWGSSTDIDRATKLSQMSNLEYVLAAEFLHDRTEKSLQELAEVIQIQYVSLYSKNTFNSFELEDISILFSDLLTYRLDLYKLTNINLKIFEGFPAGIEISDHLKTSLYLSINQNIDKIDEFLCLILDPMARNFTKNEINYPDFDLDDIDAEWSLSE